MGELAGAQFQLFIAPRARVMEGKSEDEERARPCVISLLYVLVASHLWYSTNITSSVMPLFLSLAFY